MSGKRYQIALTPEERNGSDTIAIVFTVGLGCVVVSEVWSDADEVYSNGVSVTVPARVWNQALPWIAAALRESDETKG